MASNARRKVFPPHNIGPCPFLVLLWPILSNSVSNATFENLHPASHTPTGPLLPPRVSPMQLIPALKTLPAIQRGRLSTAQFAA